MDGLLLRHCCTQYLVLSTLVHEPEVFLSREHSMRSTSFISRRQFLQATTAAGAASALSWPRVARSAKTDLIVRSAEPNNAEPPLLALVADAITPVKHFYVRNHGPKPQVDAASFKLRVEGLVGRELELSL